MNTVIMMSQPRKIKISDLNPHLICVLCGGYYVDATTIIECLHSFCKACIVRYLESNKYCPICDVQVHKTKPLQNIRADKTLQNMVYKLVPGLYQNEMHRRRDFYAKHLEASPTSNEDGGEVNENSDIYTPDESFSLSLQYLNTEEDDFSEEYSKRRFLRCPAAVTVCHLQKLIRAKFGLSVEHRVDILCMGETLQENLTLMDIAYIYRWKRKGPLHLNYCIFESRVKRLKLEHNSITDKQPSAEMECSNPSKTFDLDIIDNFQIVLNTQEVDKMKCNALKSNDTVSQDENKWKEVQIQISENGIMSVTDISVEHNNNNSEVPHGFEMPVVNDVQTKVCDVHKTTYPSSVLSPSMGEKDKVESDQGREPVKREIVSSACPKDHGEDASVSWTTTSTQHQDLADTDSVKRRTEIIVPVQDEVSSSLPLPCALLPLSSVMSSASDTKMLSKVEDFSLPKSENSLPTDTANGKEKDLFKGSEKRAFSSLNESMPVKSMRSDVKANMKRNISSRDELKPSTPPTNNGSSFSNINIKKPYAVCAPVGYKTLKTPPKSWNPSISHCNIQSSKANPLLCSSEGNMMYAKNNCGNGKSCINVPQGNPTLKHSLENSVSKPARIFKTRNVPRYLGNPASGVKPMFQAVSIANTSSKVENSSTSSLTTSYPKSSGLTVTKIDPKTLCSIAVGSSNTSVYPNPFLSNSSNISAVSSEIGSTAFPHSTTSTKNQVYSQLQNPMTSISKGPISTHSPFTQSSSNLINPSKPVISVGGVLPRSSCQSLSTNPLTPSISKNAPHLLYVFSGSANKITTPLARSNIAPSTTVGAFHPLPPPVNMLFNPHLQHHRIQNQCVITSSQTPTPSIQRVPASNFHQKLSTSNLNSGINNRSGNCNSTPERVKEECEGKESLHNYPSGVSCHFSTSLSMLSNNFGNKSLLSSRNNIEGIKNSESVLVSSSADFTTCTTSITNSYVTSSSLTTSTSTTTTTTTTVCTSATPSSLNVTIPCSPVSSTISIKTNVTTSGVNNIKPGGAFNGISTSAAIPICVSDFTTSTSLSVSTPLTISTSTKFTTSKAKSHPLFDSGSTTTTSAIGILAGPLSVSAAAVPTSSKLSSVVCSGTALIASVAPVHNMSAHTFATQCNSSLKTVAISAFPSVSSNVSAVPASLPVNNVLPVTFPLYKSTSGSFPLDVPLVTKVSGNSISSTIPTASLVPRTITIPAPSTALKLITSMTSPLSATSATASTVFASSPKGCATCFDIPFTCSTASSVKADIPNVSCSNIITTSAGASNSSTSSDVNSVTISPKFISCNTSKTTAATVACATSAANTVAVSASVPIISFVCAAASVACTSSITTSLTTTSSTISMVAKLGGTTKEAATDMRMKPVTVTSANVVKCSVAAEKTTNSNYIKPAVTNTNSSASITNNTIRATNTTLSPSSVTTRIGTESIPVSASPSCTSVNYVNAATVAGTNATMKLGTSAPPGTSDRASAFATVAPAISSTTTTTATISNTTVTCTSTTTAITTTTNTTTTSTVSPTTTTTTNSVTGITLTTITTAPAATTSTTIITNTTASTTTTPMSVVFAAAKTPTSVTNTIAVAVASTTTTTTVTTTPPITTTTMTTTTTTSVNTTTTTPTTTTTATTTTTPTPTTTTPIAITTPTTTTPTTTTPTTTTPTTTTPTTTTPTTTTPTTTTPTTTTPTNITPTTTTTPTTPATITPAAAATTTTTPTTSTATTSTITSNSTASSMTTVASAVPSTSEQNNFTSIYPVSQPSPTPNLFPICSASQSSTKSECIKIQKCVRKDSGCAIAVVTSSVLSNASFSVTVAHSNSVKLRESEQKQSHENESVIPLPEEISPLLSIHSKEQKDPLKHNECTERLCSPMGENFVQFSNEEISVNNNILSPSETGNICGKSCEDLPIKQCDTLMKKNDEAVELDVNKTADNKSEISERSEDSVLCKDAASGIQCNNNCANFVSSESDTCEHSALNNREYCKKVDLHEKCTDKCSETFTKNDNKVSTSAKVAADSKPQAASNVEKIVNTSDNEQKCSNTLKTESHNV